MAFRRLIATRQSFPCNNFNLLLAFYSTSEPQSLKGALGRVCQVSGPIVDVHFEEGLPSVLTALQVLNHSPKLLLEVGEHIGGGVVRSVAMNATTGLVRGQRVESTGLPISVPVGRPTLGRMINVVGDPIDNNGSLDTNYFKPIHEEFFENVEIPFPEVDDQTIFDADIKKRVHTGNSRRRRNTILVTGIKVIDLLAPCTLGGIIGISACDGVEKQMLAMELVNNIATARGGLSVFAGVGETGKKLYSEMVQCGLINLADMKKSKCALVYGEMNESPGARARVVHSGLSVAEHFRDCGHDVLLCVDNMLNVAEANMELSALFGPSAVGYQPTLSMSFTDLLTRIATNNNQKGSITSVQFNHILQNGPRIPYPLFTRANSSIMMCPKLYGLGILPAINPLDSTSRLMKSTALDEKHVKVASAVRGLLETCQNLENIIALEGTCVLSEYEKKKIARARKVQLLLTQPFHVAEVFTGVPGKSVGLEETIESFEAVVKGKYDHLPEEAFKMVGGIEDVVKKAAKMEESAASSRHFK